MNKMLSQEEFNRKNNAMKFIRKVSNFSVGSVCNEKGINRSNVYTGKASVESCVDIAETIATRLNFYLADYYMNKLESDVNKNGY